MFLCFQCRRRQIPCVIQLLAHHRVILLTLAGSIGDGLCLLAGCTFGFYSVFLDVLLGIHDGSFQALILRTRSCQRLLILLGGFNGVTDATLAHQHLIAVYLLSVGLHLLCSQLLLFVDDSLHVCLGIYVCLAGTLGTVHLRLPVAACFFQTGIR